MQLSSIPDLGPKKIAALKEAGIDTLWDFLEYLPRRWDDLRFATKIGDIKDDNTIVVVGEIVQAKFSFGGRLLVKLQDETGIIDIPFFNKASFWMQKLKVGSKWAVIGKRKVSRFGVQLMRSDIREINEFKPAIEPVYTITEAMKASRITNKFLSEKYKWLFEKNLNLILSPVYPQELFSYLKLRPLIELLKSMHCPQTMEEVYAVKKEMSVLKLLPFCLRIARRRRLLLNSGIARKLNLEKVEEVKNNLPFKLTAGQTQVLEKLEEGLQSERQFHALLQGDVGSGKTVIAMLATIGLCSQSVAEVSNAEASQIAIMAPTDILARQHFAGMRNFFESVGLKLSLLVGAMNAAERREILAGLKSGEINAVVGTHALFSKDVEFKNLSFVIIDEQHRFGVGQREALLAKGEKPDLLVMSATPIPRSLAMTFYGDLEAIVLREKPPGRKPVNTKIINSSKREDMKNYLYRESQSGNRCYWIVSRVQEDELGAARCVDDVYNELKRFKSDWKISVVHGQMSDTERDANLNAFARGEISLLVCTTVVEVGVNVPEANLMVIDKPESFGLSTLHQLRGRVGRGGAQAWCFLMFDDLLSGDKSETYERLEKFSKTEDGFEIAEIDLQNRGAGNLEGSEQSGAWLMRWFDWVADMPLIEKTINSANDILDNKPNFSPEVLQKIQSWYSDKKFEEIEDGVH